MEVEVKVEADDASSDTVKGLSGDTVVNPNSVAEAIGTRGSVTDTTADAFDVVSGDRRAISAAAGVADVSDSATDNDSATSENDTYREDAALLISVATRLGCARRQMTGDIRFLQVGPADFTNVAFPRCDRPISPPRNNSDALLFQGSFSNAAHYAPSAV